MAYEKSNPTDVLALKNEILNHPDFDPIDNVSVLATRVNDPSVNLGGETGPNFLRADDLMEMLFTENISAGDQFRVQLLFEMSNSPADSFDRYRSHLSALDTGLNTAINNHTRLLSRGEVLFADVVDGATERVIITEAEISQAVNS